MFQLCSTYREAEETSSSIVSVSAGENPYQVYLVTLEWTVGPAHLAEGLMDKNPITLYHADLKLQGVEYWMLLLGRVQCLMRQSRALCLILKNVSLDNRKGPDQYSP